MYVICPSCSYHYKLEAGTGQEPPCCPQCDTPPEIRRHAQPLALRLACTECAMGYLVELVPELEPVCPGCGRVLLRREVQLLERCLQLFSVRKRVALPETRSKRRGDPRIFTRKVNIDDMDPPADTLQCVPLSIARAYQVVPLRIVRGKLLLATSQPERPAMLDDLERLLTMPVLAVRVPQPALNRALDRWYSEAPADYGELLQRMAHGRRKPPRTLVRDLLRKALNDGAEEVIFRAAHQCMVIYYVCDQCSRTLQTVTTPVGRGVLRELKVLFGLPTDSRHAREGSAEWVGARGPVDLQGNTSRTDFGENFRIKVLERGR